MEEENMKSQNRRLQSISAPSRATNQNFLEIMKTTNHLK